MDSVEYAIFGDVRKVNLEHMVEKNKKLYGK